MRDLKFRITKGSLKDIGIRTDVLDGCPKVEGMMMLYVPWHIKLLQ